MSKTKLCKVPDITHDEWLDWRRKGIGGSDASTVVGLNPYNSLFALWCDKKGLLPPKETNEAMRIGHDLEQYVADRWMEAAGKKCHRNNYMWRSDEYPWMLADIDREVVGENAGLECKTTSPYNKHDFESGEVPLTYYVQCQHYMAVMGFDRMYLAVVVLGKGFYHFVVERDDNEIEALAAAERDFWQKVENDEIPEKDGSEATLGALSALYPTEEQHGCNLSDAVGYKLERMDALKKEIKEMQAEVDQIKAETMGEMGLDACGVVGPWTVTWKTQTRTSLDGKKLKAEHPDLYNQYAKITESRVFTARRKKGA